MGPGFANCWHGSSAAPSWTHDQKRAWNFGAATHCSWCEVEPVGDGGGFHKRKGSCYVTVPLQWVGRGPFLLLIWEIYLYPKVLDLTKRLILWKDCYPQEKTQSFPKACNFKLWGAKAHNHCIKIMSGLVRGCHFSGEMTLWTAVHFASPVGSSR